MSDIKVNVNTGTEEHARTRAPRLNGGDDKAAVSEAVLADAQATSASSQSEAPEEVSVSAQGSPMVEIALGALRKGGAELRKGTRFVLKKTGRAAGQVRQYSLRLPDQARASLRHFKRFRPEADFLFGDGAYEIAMDLPGIEANEISVRLSGERLMIGGARTRLERREASTGYFLEERRSGAFKRNFHMPKDADPNRIEAALINGVLQVRIPRRTAAADPSREIEVKPS